MPGARGSRARPDDHGLVELPCEERHGFVWVVPTAGAPIDLDAHLGPLDAELAHGTRLVTSSSRSGPSTATVNWKAALEAFAENYHFAYVHGQSIIGMNTLPTRPRSTAFGPTTGSASRRPGSKAPASSTTRRSSSLSLIYWVWPNLVLAVTAVGSEVIDILPGATSDRCRVRHGLLLNIRSRRGDPGGVPATVRGRPRRSPRRGLQHAPAAATPSATPSTTTW